MQTDLPKPEGVYRVIHSADWHLGKMLGSLDRTEEHQRFLDWLEATLVAVQADALVIAGDVFDSATPPQSAVRMYFDFLASLHAKCGCQVVITAGNHDSPAHLDAARDLLRVINVHVSATLPKSEDGALDASAILIPLPSPEAPRLVVAALPFLRERDLRTGEFGQSADVIRRELQEGLTKRYAEAAEAAKPWLERAIPVIATGHLTALGSAVSESEREIHVGGLGSVGAEAFPTAFAYVALGHLHRPQTVGNRETVRYSGSPLMLSFSEAADRKEVRLLDFSGNRLVANQSLPVPQPRPFVRLKIPHAELKTRLRQFEPPAGDLMPWVEITITEANGSEDLCEAVREATANRPFQVIRVLAERTTPIAPLGLDDDSADEEADALLSNPKAVFQRRLEQETPRGDSRDHDPLSTAFAELCALLEERRC